MLDGSEPDGGGKLRGAFLADLVRALILEGLALDEGQGGAQIAAGKVGVVALGQLVQIAEGLVGDHGHFLAVEDEGLVAAVILGLDEGVGAVAHQDLALFGIGVVDQGEQGIQRAGVAFHAGLGDSPGVAGLHAAPALGEPHVDAVLGGAVIPAGHGDHDAGVLLAFLQGCVQNGLGLVVVIGHEAQILGQVVLGGADFLAGHVGGGDQAFQCHVVHTRGGGIGIGALPGVMQRAVSAEVQVILAGFIAADAEQQAAQAVYVRPAGHAVFLAGEQALDGVGAVQALGISHDAAQQGDHFIGVPAGVKSAEQVGTGGSVISAVGLVDILTEHVHSVHAVHGAGFVHLRHDVAVGVIVLGQDLSRAAVRGGRLDLDLAAGGHVGLIDGGCGVLAGVRGERAFAVQQLLQVVHAHQGHLFDVVHAVKVRSEVERARVGIGGDGQAHDGIRVQIGDHVRDLVGIVGQVDQAAGLAVGIGQGAGAQHHVHLVQLLFPVVEFLGVSVALIHGAVDDDVFAGDLGKDLLHFHPGGLQVAGVIGVAVAQGDAFTRDVGAEGQTGVRVVIADSHTQRDVFRVRDGGNAENHRTCQHKGQDAFHRGSSFKI